MEYQLPVVDDTLIWDAWLSMYRVPSLSVALELELFESLDARPDTPEGLAERRGFDARALRALLAMLRLMGFLREHAGVYQLDQAGRQYMLKSSPFYWGPFFARVGPTINAHRLLLETVNGERAKGGNARPSDGWEAGHVEMDMARTVTGFMHCHSLPAAVGMTRTQDLSGMRRLLDVAGGSGCFSIAMAQRDPELRCTVMELPTICILAREYIAKGGVADRVDTVSVDMFREPWPKGYDTHFFSNVFHDWSPETCLALARSSFEALPCGGRILLHEMLLDDSGTSPEPAVAFSLVMAIGTRGQQFSFPELRDILAEAGFRRIRTQPSYGYYSLVCAEKD